MTARFPRLLALATTVAVLLGIAGLSMAPPRRILVTVRDNAVDRLICGDCNLLLVSVDTLRASHLSAYGYGRPTSPHIENLARDGVLFERFYESGGGTLESHMSMLTSLNPLTHGVLRDNGRALPEERVTLAEQLKASGFATAAFVDDGYLLRKYGFAQGFDVYDDTGGHFATILPRAHEWLKTHHDKRFFLFVHTYDVHSATRHLPYECPGDYPARYTHLPRESWDGCRNGLCASDFLAWVNAGVRERRFAVKDVLTDDDLAFMSSLYDGCINYADDRVADLLGAVRELGEYDRTLVVFTSDHGEEFAEHGMLIHDQGGYEELAHIPLILKLPYSRLQDRRVHRLAAMIDVMPSVLSLLDVPIPAQTQGRSLLPAIAWDRVVRNDVSLFNVLTTERWKYFMGNTRGTDKLYDLQSDPNERSNLYDASSPVVSELQARLQKHIRADEEARRSFDKRSRIDKTVTLSDEERERLQSLGYIVD